MSANSAPLNLEPAGSYDELLDMLDDVRVARGLSFEHLTELSGLAADHAQKIMGPARVKTLSRMTLDALLPSLGVKLIAVNDPQAIAGIEQQWVRRDETNVRKNTWRVSRRILDRARPAILQELIESLTTAAAEATEKLKKPAAKKAKKQPLPPALASPRLVHEQPEARPAGPASYSHLRVIQEKRCSNIGARDVSIQR